TVQYDLSNLILHKLILYKVNPVIPKRAVLLVKKPGKFGLNGFYIVNSINRGKITMTGFDSIFSITEYHLMFRYNGVRYNGVDFVCICKNSGNIVKCEQYSFTQLDLICNRKKTIMQKK